MSDEEALTLRTTVIGGIRYADDYAVVWRGLSIGRIMKAIGAASDKQQWAWNCYIHGRPSSADHSGAGHDLDDAKAKLRAGVGAHPRRAHGVRHRARGITPKSAVKHSPGMIESDDR